MRRAAKVALGSVVVLFLLGVVTGCGERISGLMYVNQDHPEQYIKLNDDGSAYLGGCFGGETGRWKIDDGELEITIRTGRLSAVGRWKIKRGTLIDSDGGIWKKVRRTRIFSGKSRKKYIGKFGKTGHVSRKAAKAREKSASRETDIKKTGFMKGIPIGRPRESRKTAKNSCRIALMTAAARGDIGTVQTLLAEGADVNDRTALMNYAAFYGRTEIVQILLAEGADVNVKDSGGKTALMYASMGGRTGTVQIVQTLLANGADVNVKNNSGDTALMWAAYKGHTGIVQALLAEGADVNAKNNDGDTALMGAANKEHTDIVNLLRDAGARE